MKRIFILLLSIVIFSLSGCNRTADMILREDDLVEVVEADAPVDDTDVEAEAVVQPEPDDTGIFVYLCGAVQQPGVYELEADSRVYELVEKAGGFAEDADEYSVNLADTLQDGQMVRIYTVEEAAAISESGQDIEGNSGPGQTSDGKIDINSATVQELQTLTGVGESKANEIVAFRESNGPFRTTEDIMKVSGIGEGTYKKIEDSIRVQ